MARESKLETGLKVFIDQDGWYYAEYRLEDEPPLIIHVRQRGPLCSGTDFAKEVAVAGISREPYRTNAERFCRGTYRWLELQRQPSEKFPQAITVIGRWWEGGAEQSAQIGWVPDQFAKRVHSTIPEGTLRARLYLIFLPTEDKSHGLRFDLLHARREDSLLGQSQDNTAKWHGV